MHEPLELPPSVARENHVCGWPPCSALLPCPHAKLDISPCRCMYPTLALVGESSQSESELFFCDATNCRQLWLDNFFTIDSDSGEDEEASQDHKVK